MAQLLGGWMDMGFLGLVHISIMLFDASLGHVMSTRITLLVDDYSVSKCLQVVGSRIKLE